MSWRILSGCTRSGIRGFYRGVFGWSASKLPDPVNYWQLQTSEASAQQGIPDGIVESRSGEARVSVTVQGDSIDEVCAQVTRLGGRLITERLRVPGYGVHVLAGIHKVAISLCLSRSPRSDQRLYALRAVTPNPRMQPTGRMGAELCSRRLSDRGGPEFLTAAPLPAARQRKRSFVRAHRRQLICNLPGSCPA